MCNCAVSQRQYYNISPRWSSSIAGILVHYRRCNHTELEPRSRAGAGVRLNSRYYQVAVLETCSTGWRSSSTGWRLARQQVLSSSYWRLARQQVLETCSTAGGKMQLHIISFERREGNSWSQPAISLEAPCTASTSAVTLCVTGYEVLVR